MKQNITHQPFFSEDEVLWLNRIRKTFIASMWILLPVLPIWEQPAQMLSRLILRPIAVNIDKACELLRKGSDEPFNSSKWKGKKSETKFEVIQETLHHRWQMCKSAQLILPNLSEYSVIALLGEPGGRYGTNHHPLEPGTKDKYLDYSMEEGYLVVHLHEGNVVESSYSRFMRE